MKSDNTHMSVYQFFAEVKEYARKNNQRYGQAAFNCLHAIRPELAKLVELTNKDPFYAISVSDPALARFIEFINSNW